MVHFSQAFSYFVSHFGQDYVRPLKLLLADHTGRSLSGVHYRELSLLYVRDCFEGWAFPSTAHQSVTIDSARQPVVRLQVCDFIFSSDDGKISLHYSNDAGPSQEVECRTHLFQLLSHDFEEVIRTLSLFCEQEAASNAVRAAVLGGNAVAASTPATDGSEIDSQLILSVLLFLAANGTTLECKGTGADFEPVQQFLKQEWTLSQKSAVYQLFAETSLRLQMGVVASSAVDAFNFFLHARDKSSEEDTGGVASIHSKHRVQSGSFCEDMVIDLLRAFPQLVTLCSQQRSSDLETMSLTSITEDGVAAREPSARSRRRSPSEGTTDTEKDCLAALQQRGMWRAQVHVYECVCDFAGAIGVFLQSTPSIVSSQRVSDGHKLIDAKEVFEYVIKLARKLLQEVPTRRRAPDVDSDDTAEQTQVDDYTATDDAIQAEKLLASLRGAVTRKFRQLIALDADRAAHMIQVCGRFV